MQYKKCEVLNLSINSYDQYPLSWQPDRTLLTRPYYRSLVQQLEADILSHRLQKNTRLPSQRELADFLDINFTTVGRAYKYGLEKGLLYTNIGSGTFVSQNAFNSITISNHNVDHHLIDLGLVSSFEECNDLVTPYLARVSQQPNVQALLTYQDPLGTPQQRHIAAEWLQTQGVSAVDRDNIAIVAGVQNGLAITLAGLFNPGDRIAVDRYTYSNFIELANLLQIEVVLIDGDQDGMLPNLLATECHKKKIHGVFLMPACNNPVGFQMTAERRLALAAIFATEALLVIEDDIHAFLTNFAITDQLPTFQSLLPRQTIYLASMAKFISSGLRVAYLVYPNNYRSRIERSIFNINVKTSAFDAEVVTQILQSPTAKTILARKLALTQQANQLFDELFEQPQPTNPVPFYRILPVSPQIDQTTIENYFLEQGVRIYHSNRFTTKKQPDPFIRIALSSNHIDLLEQALLVIAEHIKQFQ